MTKPSEICSVGGCDRPRFCRGWCALHYGRWYHHGTTDGGVARRERDNRPSMMERISETDRAYAAGLIDGEGTIGVSLEKKGTATQAPSHRPYLAVNMTHEGAVRWLHELFGVGAVRYTPHRPPRQQQWGWRVNGYAVRTICDLIHPHLKVKRIQAYLITCFYEEGHWRAAHGKRVPDEEVARREAIKQELHEWNARGVAAYGQAEYRRSQESSFV